MIAESSPGGTPDKYSRGLNSLVFEAITNPVRMEMMDPVVRKAIKAMTDLRSRIRENPLGHLPSLPSMLEQANQQLYTDRLFGAEIVVTGKLRPSATGLESTDEEGSDTLWVEPVFRKLARELELGEMHEDEAGPYYLVTAQRMHCGTIGASYVEAIPGQPDIYAWLNLVVDEGEDPSDTVFAMMNDEIDLITTDRPSPAMIGEILKGNFPDIFAALQSIPCGESDLRKVQQALSTFRLYIDQDKYKHRDLEEIVDLEEMIGVYITDRLGLDDGWYSLKLKGCVIVPQLQDGKVVPTPVPIEKPTKRAVRILQVSLFERPAPKDMPESVSMYELQLEVESRLFNGKVQAYDVPMDSLIKIKSLSSESWTPNAVVDDPPTDYFAEQFEPANGDGMTDAAASAAAEREQPIAQSAESYIAERIRLYEALDIKLRKFLEKCETSNAMLFDDQLSILTEAQSMRLQISQDIGELLDLKVATTFQGTAIKYMPITTEENVDDNQISLTVQRGAVKRGAPETRMTGNLMDSDVTMHEVACDDGKVRMRMSVELLVSNPHTTKRYALKAKGTNHAYYRGDTVQAFRVELGKDTKFDIAHLKWLKDVTDKILNFKVQYPDEEDLADELLYLFATVDQLSMDPNSHELPIDSLQRCNDAMLFNPALAHDLPLILSEIFIDKAIGAEGDYYTPDGEVCKNKPIMRSLVVGVMVPIDGPGADEGIFVLTMPDKRTVRVPIAKLTRMIY